MKRKGHQFSNLSQSPFLSVLFKGQVSFALENLKPVVWPVGQPYGQEGIPFTSKKE